MGSKAPLIMWGLAAGCFGLPSASPFCMKLESWLRMKGVPYELRAVSNPYQPARSPSRP